VPLKIIGLDLVEIQEVQVLELLMPSSTHGVTIEKSLQILDQFQKNGQCHTHPELKKTCLEEIIAPHAGKSSL